MKRFPLNDGQSSETKVLPLKYPVLELHKFDVHSTWRQELAVTLKFVTFPLGSKSLKFTQVISLSCHLCLERIKVLHKSVMKTEFYYI